MSQIIPLALSVNTVAVMWLAGSKRALGWALGLAGQAGWLLFVVVFEAWGLLPLVVALTFVYARNLWRWYADAADPSPTEQHHRWRATGGNGTASIVSRIGGPAFAVMRHGNPDVAIAEMVAAALNECPWLTIPAADPSPTDRTHDADVHVERCGSSECPCYQEGHRAGAELAAEFVATLRDAAADPAPTGDQP